MFERISLFLSCLLTLTIPLLSTFAQGPDSAQTSPAQAGSIPASPRAAAFARAQKLYRNGKLGDAENEYNALLQGDSRSALAYVGLVRVYLKQQRIADASVAAAKAVELAPPLSAVHVAMGEVHFRQGKMDESEKEFLKEIKRGTTEARAYLGMERLYKAFSFNKSAKKMIERAYQLDPTDPDIQKNRLWTLSREEQIKSLQAYLAGETNDDAEARDELLYANPPFRPRSFNPYPCERFESQVIPDRFGRLWRFNLPCACAGGH